MSDNDNDDEARKNVFTIMSGGKGNTPSKEIEDAVPSHEYEITTRNGEVYNRVGFLLFTSQHVAIARDTPMGSLPVFLMPLDRIELVDLVEYDEDEEEEVPF